MEEPFTFTAVKVGWVLSTLLGWSVQAPVGRSDCKQHGSAKVARHPQVTGIGSNCTSGGEDIAWWNWNNYFLIHGTVHMWLSLTLGSPYPKNLNMCAHYFCRYHGSATWMLLLSGMILGCQCMVVEDAHCLHRTGHWALETDPVKSVILFLMFPCWLVYPRVSSNIWFTYHIFFLTSLALTM